jgi:pimeloyl-ACP methyl ester carboxylesterase
MTNQQLVDIPINSTEQLFQKPEGRIPGYTEYRDPQDKQLFQLPDGRMLGYAEYGDPQGKPLFYFHGWPSSRIEFAGMNGNEIAAKLHVRVISVDRPGFGLSSYQPHHRFIDWPQDINCLADYLGLGQFAVMSYSAGSPYALACAYNLVDRLTAVGVVSGLAQPLSTPGVTRGMPTIMLWRTARIHPRLTAMLFNMMKNTITNGPRDQLPKSSKQAMMSETDFAFIQQYPSISAANMDGGAEAIRQGGLGPAEAAALYWKPWGFRLDRIRMKVLVWHGEKDLNAPFNAHGKVLAEQLPNVDAKFYQNEGHISLIHKNLKTIMQELTN